MPDQIRTPTEEQHPSGGISLFVVVPSGQTIHIELSVEAMLIDLYLDEAFNKERTFTLLFQGVELSAWGQPCETLANLGICPESTLHTKETFMFTFKRVDGPDGVSREQVVRSTNKERWNSEDYESIPEPIRDKLDKGKTIARKWAIGESFYAWGYYNENEFVVVYREYVNSDDDHSSYPEEEYRSYTESDYERRDNEWHEHYDEECAEDSRWYTDSDYEDRYYDDRNY